MSLVFSPADIEDEFGYTTEQQTTWRARGFLMDFGSKGDNGRWQYSFLDALGFFTAKYLSDYLGIESALMKGRSSANAVLFWAQSAHSGAECSAPRYRVFWRGQSVGGDFMVHELTEMNRGSASATPASFFVLDHNKVASELSGYFKALAPLAKTE